MENVKDILKGINDRLASPLIFSFLLSWLVFNWEITVGLLWYDVASIRMEGNTMIDYIQSRLDWNHSLKYPSILAIVYTLGGPVIKNLINAFNTWVAKWGESWNLKISKGAKIPVEKYLSLRKELDQRSETLEKEISRESVKLKELREAQTKLLDSQNQQNQLQAEIAKLQKHISSLQTAMGSISNVEILDGRWIRTVYNPLGEEVENIQVLRGRITMTQGVRRVDKYSIQHFIYDPNSKRVQIVLFKISTDGAHKFYAFNELTFEFGGLRGHEYRAGLEAQVTYKRSQDNPNITVGDEAPANPKAGDIWIDTNDESSGDK